MNIRLQDDDRDPTVIELPGVVFPVQLEIPAGFDPEDLRTWPAVEGRLEYVGGRLLYMPPTGGRQTQTVADVVVALGAWVRANPDYVLGTGEAGMKLGDDVRGADAAVWRASELSSATDQVARTAPVLAVEVAGRDDTEALLRDKARWYLDRGVAVVWILMPASREAIVVTGVGESRHAVTEPIAPAAELPGLTVTVADLFRQVSR